MRVEVPAGGPADGPTAGARSADARLARLHLRGGLLPLARAALEQMAGAGSLDVEAMADLAEARWRSGDLEGAAEAAGAHQASGGQEPLAALILAEDLARAGRQQEAMRLAESVYGRVGGAVDVLFAGELRSGVWPAPDDGWMDLDAPSAGRFGLLVGGREVAAPDPQTWRVAPLSEARPPSVPGQPIPTQPPGPSSVLPAGRGGIEGPGGRTGASAMVTTGRLAGEELAEVDRDLAAGRIAAAAQRLAVLLRLEPALAPIILSAADRAASSAPPGSGLAAVYIVRGDAYRNLGRENEAAAAYQQAHQALASGPSSEEPM